MRRPRWLGAAVIAAIGIGIAGGYWLFMTVAGGAG